MAVIVLTSAAALRSVRADGVAIRRAGAMAALLSSAAGTTAIEPQEPSDPDGVVLWFPGRLPAHQLSPDGTLPATASLDGSVVLWDVSTGKESMPRLSGGYVFQSSRWRGSPGKLAHFLFSPNGRSLAAYWDVPKGTVNFHYAAKAAVWDLQRRAPATQIPLGLPLAFSPDGSALLLDADGPLLTLDVASGKTRVLAEESPYDHKFETPYPDLVAFVRGDNLTFWNLTSGTPALPPFVLPRSKDMDSSSLVFSADQRVAALVAIDEVFLWDVPSRQQLGAASRKSSAFSRLAFGGYAQAVVNSNGSVLAWVAGGGNSNNFDLTIWDVAKGRVIGTFGPKRADTVPAVAISPDGTVVAAHGLGAGILVFRLPSDGSVVEPLVLSPGTGKRKRNDGPSGLSFGPNGKVLAAYSSGALDLWDVTGPAPKPLGQLPASAQVVATDSGVLIVPTEEGTKLVDIADPDKATSPIVLPGLTGDVSCAAGCRVFASTSYLKAGNVTTIRLRNLASILARR